MGKQTAKYTYSTKFSPEAPKLLPPRRAEEESDILEFLHNAEELKDNGKISDELFRFAVRAAVLNVLNSEIHGDFSSYIERKLEPMLREMLESGVL